MTQPVMLVLHLLLPVLVSATASEGTPIGTLMARFARNYLPMTGDCAGSSLGEPEKLDVVHCAAKCDGEPKCVAFAHRHDGVEICVLKEALCDKLDTMSKYSIYKKNPKAIAKQQLMRKELAALEAQPTSQTGTPASLAVKAEMTTRRLEAAKPKTLKKKLLARRAAKPGKKHLSKQKAHAMDKAAKLAAAAKKSAASKARAAERSLAAKPATHHQEPKQKQPAHGKATKKASRHGRHEKLVTSGGHLLEMTSEKSGRVSVEIPEHLRHVTPRARDIPGVSIAEITAKSETVMED